MQFAGGEANSVQDLLQLGRGMDSFWIQIFAQGALQRQERWVLLFGWQLQSVTS